MAITYVTCSWCHSLNYASARTCPGCGHDPRVPRTQCTCKRCRPAPSPIGTPASQVPADCNCSFDPIGLHESVLSHVNARCPVHGRGL